MASFKVDGLDDLQLAFSEVAQLPDDVIDSMLIVEAEIIAKAQKAVGRAYGVHRTGVTLSSIKRGNPRRRKDGKEIVISPHGKNKDGNRNAEVAFINEYGKDGQTPRPFIRDANEANADEATSAGAEVYDNWLKTKGL